MKILLSVILCSYSIAFSLSLPQCAHGMPTWPTAAICSNCSNPSVAITQIGNIWFPQVTLALCKQTSATSCATLPSERAHEHALHTYADLKPPWTNLNAENGRVCTAEQPGTCLYFAYKQWHPVHEQLGHMAAARPTRPANRYTTHPPEGRPFCTKPPVATRCNKCYTTHTCTHLQQSLCGLFCGSIQKSPHLLRMLPTSAFSLSQSLSKDRLQLHASWVHISGFTGNPEAMHNQLQMFLDTQQLPLTHEAHHILDQEIQKGPNDKFGHVISGQVLSTHSKRSIVFPLQYETVFAPNPDSAALHGTHEQLVFPLRMVSSLPAPAGHHGRMPTLTAQPWFVDPEADLQLISRFFGFTRLHCHCLDDIYATCLLQIQVSFQKQQCEGIGFVQLLWHNPAVPSGKGQAKSNNSEQSSRIYPHTLYVYLVASPDINLHTFILSEALPPPGQGYRLLDFYPCLHLATRGPLSAAHLARKPPDTTCWLLLLDVRRVPLHYVHLLLLSVGISPHAILGIAYTSNGGLHKQELAHPTNVLIHLSSQHDLDRLHDGWFGAEATNCINNGATVTTHRSTRLTQLRPTHKLQRLTPLPSLTEYSDRVTGALHIDHIIDFARLVPVSRFAAPSTQPPTPSAVTRHMPTAPRAESPPKRGRTVYEQSAADAPAEDMDIDAQDMPSATALALRAEDKPDHGTVLLARLETAVQRVMDHDPVSGLRTLRALLAKHKHLQRDRASAAGAAITPDADAEEHLVGTGVLLPCQDADLLAHSRALLAATLAELHGLQATELSMDDWYGTKGNGLCGYYAFASCLGAIRNVAAPSLLSLAACTLQFPNVSPALTVKLQLMRAYLLDCDSETAPHACWCSIADLLELADLHLLDLTVWIGVPSTASTTCSEMPATVTPYRHNRAAGGTAHIALYAHHFCHMRHAPYDHIRLQLPPARCIDESVGCGVPTLCMSELTAQQTETGNMHLCVGGMLAKPPAEAPTTSVDTIDSTATTLVPGHTIAAAVAQRWDGMGALVRLLQHELPPRAIKLDRKTAQLWRYTLEHVITSIPAGRGGNAMHQLKCKLAQAITGASRADSLKYPLSAALSAHELLLLANTIHMPLVIWRSPQPDANHTMCKCVLHACSATAAAVPWHYVQHVAHIGEYLVRIESPVPLTAALQQQVAARSSVYSDLLPQPRLHHLSPSSPHTIAHQQHLLLRDLEAAKHVMHPTLPHLRTDVPSRGTRHSQRRHTALPAHPSEHSQLRRLPLSPAWLQHPDFVQSDPEVLLHYWNHRGCNQYARLMYIDNVAGKGEVGLCATTYIVRGTLIAPYLGTTKSRRHSREYSATALDTVIDAADIYSDYGYQLFDTQPSTLAPPNVARYANSLRATQRDKLQHNARLEVSESAGFGTLWLQAIADIHPGEEILCDYGEQFALPTSSPQQHTPLSPGSQQCDSGIARELTGASTDTLVEHTSSVPLSRHQRKRSTKREAPANPLPRRRAYHRACAPTLPVAWDDTDDEPTTQEQHVPHLHPAGPAYSSDEAGDGPQPPCADTLHASFLPLVAQVKDDHHPTVTLATTPILMDHSPAALRHIRAAFVACTHSLRPSDLRHLLEHEVVATLSQPMAQQSFRNTQALGYCGYIVVLQAVLLHLYSWHSYPDLTVSHWRHALAQLLDIVTRSTVVLPSVQVVEHSSLLDKLPRISMRLRTNSDDHGALEACLWLSSDEVACALTLLGIPSTLWIHSESLRIYDALPPHSLVLMQSTPDCALPMPLHAPATAAPLLSRMQIGFARSHFFILRAPAAPSVGDVLAAEFYQRSSRLNVEQLDWLLHSNPYAAASGESRLLSTPLRTVRLSTSTCSAEHVGPAPTSQQPSPIHPSSPPRPVSSLTPPPSMPPPSPPATPDSPPASPPPIPSSSSLSPSARQVAAARPSRRRKHKRRARAAAAKILATHSESPIFSMSAAALQTEQQLNVAYWNTNGHLTGDSSFVLCQTIQHLQLDVCVLIDTRLSKQAGEYHAAAIKHFLPGSMVVLHNTTRCHVRQAGGQRMQTMGGAMYILSPRCASRLITSCPDNSELGVAGYIKLAYADTVYCIYHAYVPPPPTSADGPATLNSRLRRYLDSQHRTISPQEYVLSQLAAWITRARRQNIAVIAGGDFNMDPAQKRGASLLHWMHEAALAHAMDHLHLPAVHNTHLIGGIPRTRLDHIYLDASAIHQLRTAHVLYEPHTMSLSDHCLVYAGIHCPGLAHLPRPPPQPPPSPRLELPHHNTLLVEHYQRRLTLWTQQHSPAHAPADPHEAATLLGALMGATTHAVKYVTRRRRRLQQRVGHRSRFKDGYSPLYCALKHALLLLLALQRDLHHNGMDTSCASQRSSLACYLHSLHEWQTRYAVASFPEVQHVTLTTVAKLLAARGAGTLQPCAVANDIDTVRRMMHGRKRTEWRRQHSDRLALLEDMRLTQKFKQLFRRIGVKERPHLSLDTLSTSDGLLTDPYDIHCALTTHFTEWYRTPDFVHPFARQLHNPAWLQDLLHGTATLCDDLPPTFKQQEFLDACRMRTTAQQQQQINDVVAAPLSWGEYMAEIDLLCFGKAPGPSGVTATMIKSWPTTTHELVFSCLTTIWQHRTTPHWWLHSYLHPIPKKGATTLENLRPLGLYEITRKLLAAIIIKRAYRTWESLRLLHPHQHAYRRGVSTSTAILRLLNLVEDAEETGHPLLVTAWDIKRAFDSIPHAFIRLALCRLGLSDTIAAWFHHMLSHNIVTVQSPHVQRHGTGAFPAHPARFQDVPHSNAIPSFHQERGIGQGDTPSAILWIALYDILLCMLDTPPMARSGHYLARGPLHTVYAAGCISYADDLCTPASSLQLSQSHANIVSTYCAATTLMIAAQKVLAFSLNSPTSTHLTIYDWHWQPHAVPFSHTGVAMTYLGLDAAHHMGDAPAHATTDSCIRAGTTALRYRQASPSCKQAVVCMQLYPKLLYPAAKACWSLREYRSLDRALAKLLKHTSRYMDSVANDMLYFPVTHGGTGQHKLSDFAQARKWRELQHALASTGEVAMAAHGLLERGMRQLEYLMPSSLQRTFPSQQHRFLKCFVGSLIEWGAEVHCSLTVTPSSSFHPNDSPITPYLHPQLHADLLSTLQQRDIVMQGELCTRRRDGTLRWLNDSFTTLLRTALGDHAIDLPHTDALTLAAGQMYHVLPCDQYLEIYGTLADALTPTLIVRLWTPDSTSALLRHHLHDPPGLHHIPLATLAGQQWYRLTTTPARATVLHANRRILHRSACVNPHPARRCNIAPHTSILNFQHDILLAQGATGCAYHLFTDGSFNIPDLPPSAILESEATRRNSGRATAAIVALSDPLLWRQHPAIVLYITAGDQHIDGSSAYTAELLALTIAAQIVARLASAAALTPAIHSDCRAAIDTLRAAANPLARTRMTECTHILTAPISTIALPRLHWVRSHPERRTTDTSRWTFFDWGIHLADLAASGAAMSQHHPDALTLMHSLDYCTAIRSLIPPATWHWTSSVTRLPLLCSPLQLLHQLRVQHYLHQRDHVWRSCTLPPRWVGTSLTHAAKGWRLLRRERHLHSTTALRHCLDKCWHGRNRAKGIANPDRAADALACPHCSQPDDQMHAILCCEHQQLAALRNTAHQHLAQAADALLQERSIASTPLLVSLIYFIVAKSSDYQYQHVDRIWLGTWNHAVLHDCLVHNRPPHYAPPPLLPHALIQRFDHIAARMHVILLRAFLQLYTTAKCRLLPEASSAPTTSPPATGSMPRCRTQQRLTTLWSIPPPYVSDHPLSQATKSTAKQQTLEAYLPTVALAPQPHQSPAAPDTPCTSSTIAGTVAALTHVCQTPVPSTSAVHHPSSVRNSSMSAFMQRFLQRVHTPHVAANAANSTSDYDKD